MKSIDEPRYPSHCSLASRARLTPPSRSRVLSRWRFVWALVISAFAASCANVDESTGSESHFVSCRTDGDCPRGSCVDDFCEENGERITNVSTIRAGEGEMTSSDSGDSPSDGDTFGCIDVERTPVELSDVGLTPEDFTLDAATAELSWDGSGWTGALDVVPITGSTEVTVSLSVDAASAERVTQTPAPNQGGLRPPCPEIVELDLSYSFVTADGSFDESGTVKQAVNPEVSSMSFSLPVEELLGSLRFDPVDPDASVLLSFALWWPDQEFSGRVGLQVSSRDGNATNSSAQPGFATFSRTGCGVGYWSTSWEGSFGGRLLADEQLEFASPRVWSAVWEDTNAETELILLPEPTAGQALCHDARELLIAVEMMASTRDGRLDQVPLRGSRRLAAMSDDPERMLDRQWSGNGDVLCGAEASFDGLDCNTMAGFATDFSFTNYDAYPMPGSGRLSLYLYGSEPVGEGSADEVIRLDLFE